jgi:hypothetical protein
MKLLRMQWRCSVVVKLFPFSDFIGCSTKLVMHNYCFLAGALCAEPERYWCCSAELNSDYSYSPTPELEIKYCTRKLPARLFRINTLSAGCRLNSALRCAADLFVAEPTDADQQPALLPTALIEQFSTRLTALALSNPSSECGSYRTSPPTPPSPAVLFAPDTLGRPERRKWEQCSICRVTKLRNLPHILFLHSVEAR